MFLQQKSINDSFLLLYTYYSFWFQPFCAKILHSIVYLCSISFSNLYNLPPPSIDHLSPIYRHNQSLFLNFIVFNSFSFASLAPLSIQCVHSWILMRFLTDNTVVHAICTQGYNIYSNTTATIQNARLQTEMVVNSYFYWSDTKQLQLRVFYVCQMVPTTLSDYVCFCFAPLPNEKYLVGTRHLASK